MGNRFRAKKIWKKVLLSILCVFFSVSFFAGIFIWFWLSKIQISRPGQNPHAQNGYSETPYYDEGSRPQSDTAPGKGGKTDSPDAAPFGKSGVLNILLVSWEQNRYKKERSPEAIMLLSYDSSAGVIRTVPVLKELLVSIPGYKKDRLDAAFSLGGSALLAKTIENEFGLKADGCFVAETEKLAEIIDSMGGVDMTLTPEESKALGLKPGVNSLDGQKALAYSRIRGGVSDFEEAARQRNLMYQALLRISELRAAEKLKLLEKLLPCLETDMPRQRIVSLFLAVLKNGVTGIDQSQYHIPESGTYRIADMGGVEVLVPDVETNRALLKKWLYKS